MAGVSLIQVVLGACTSFIVALIAVIALRPMAVAVSLIDRPGGRKTHHGNIPVVGGLAMFLGITVGAGIMHDDISGVTLFSSACGLLVVVGMFDDRFNLPPSIRLAAQAVAAIAFMVGSGAVISNFGDPLGVGAFHLSVSFSYVVTIVLMIGLLNAFNMLDGMDGLAGSMAIVSFFAFAYLAWRIGFGTGVLVSAIFIGAVAAFLLFNLPFRYNRDIRCFMGDAGSTCLGFALGAVGILLSQRPAPYVSVSPVTILWIVAMPIFELLWSTVRRIRRGNSPFQADTEHFHHVLIDAGFSVRGAFMVYSAFAVLIATLGIIFEEVHISEFFSFALFLTVGVLVIYTLYHSTILFRILPDSAHRPTRSTR